MTKPRPITVEEGKMIRESLSYNAETGIVTWLIGRKGTKGSIAGSLTKSTGYWTCMLKERNYGVHRIAWFLHNNEWPSDQIDHINGIRDDNRIKNLRVTSNKENGKNQKRSINNTSGVTGVYWCKSNGKWRANIMLDGKTIHLGRFEDFDKAVEVRKSAEKKYNFHANHGRN